MQLGSRRYRRLQGFWTDAQLKEPEGIWGTLRHWLHLSHWAQLYTLYSSPLIFSLLGAFFSFLIFRLYQDFSLFYYSYLSASYSYFSTSAYTYSLNFANSLDLEQVLFSRFLSISVLLARTVDLLHLQTWVLGSWLSQSRVAQLMASAMLTPKLKPQWQLPPRTSINSLGLCQILLILSSGYFFLRLYGLIRVVLCLRCYGHLLKCSANNALASFSRIWDWLEGMLYQNLDFPSWRQLMAERSRSSLCQQKRVFHDPMQQQEVVTPLTFRLTAYLSSESRWLRFQEPADQSMRVVNRSAPQRGGEKTIFFQNCYSFMVTIASTSDAESPSVILSKTPILVRYSLQLIDFFWMCRHSYTPLFPKMFCSMGPFIIKFSRRCEQSELLAFHSGGGTTQNITKDGERNKSGVTHACRCCTFTMPYLDLYCWSTFSTQSAKFLNYFQVGQSVGHSSMAI